MPYNSVLKTVSQILMYAYLPLYHLVPLKTFTLISSLYTLEFRQNESDLNTNAYIAQPSSTSFIMDHAFGSQLVEQMCFHRLWQAQNMSLPL